jgi:hypothetical protein
LGDAILEPAASGGDGSFAHALDEKRTAHANQSLDAASQCRAEESRLKPVTEEETCGG